MTPKSYQPQNNPGSDRVRCPVCHETVYSRAGIHPQCAVRQSDPPRPKNKPAEIAAVGVDIDPMDDPTLKASTTTDVAPAAGG
jgi:hypothetical protein